MSKNTTYFHGGNGSFFRAHYPHSSIAYSGFGVKSFGISSGNHLTYFGSQDTEDTDF